MDLRHVGLYVLSAVSCGLTFVADPPYDYAWTFMAWVALTWAVVVSLLNWRRGPGKHSPGSRNR